MSYWLNFHGKVISFILYQPLLQIVASFKMKFCQFSNIYSNLNTPWDILFLFKS